MLSILTFISFLSIFMTLWAVVRWHRVRLYWKDKNVPYESPNPIMGNLTFLQRENPAVFMKKLYKKFQSPYVGIWLFWRPALVINCPEIARRVLVKDSDVFRNRFLHSGKTDPVGSLTLFLVDLTCTDFTTDVIGEAAFGVVTETTKTGDSIMRKVTREFMHFNIQRGLSWSSIFFLPELVDVFGFSLFPKHTTEFLRHILRSIVEQRGGYNRDISESKDLLDALLKLKKEAMESGEEISEDLLLAQASVFLLGGFDTSGSLLTWILLELCHQPKMQKRLHDELMEAKEKLGGKDFDPTTLAELPYLNAVIKETLRKNPPMGWLDRIASQDYVIDQNLTIPAKTVVYVNVIGMQWDPNFFPEPEKFDPERFMPQNEGYIKPYTFMPFGEGPRNCIGLRFGYQTVRYGLAAIISHFEVQPLPTTPFADDVEVEKKGMFLTPAQQISVKCVPWNKDL